MDVSDVRTNPALIAKIAIPSHMEVNDEQLGPEDEEHDDGE